MRAAGIDAPLAGQLVHYRQPEAAGARADVLLTDLDDGIALVLDLAGDGSIRGTQPQHDRRARTVTDRIGHELAHHELDPGERFLAGVARERVTHMRASQGDGARLGRKLILASHPYT